MEINLSRRAVQWKVPLGFSILVRERGLRCLRPWPRFFLNGFVWRDHTCGLLKEKGGIMHRKFHISLKRTLKPQNKRSRIQNTKATNTYVNRKRCLTGCKRWISQVIMNILLPIKFKHMRNLLVFLLDIHVRLIQSPTSVTLKLLN